MCYVHVAIYVAHSYMPQYILMTLYGQRYVAIHSPLMIELCIYRCITCSTTQYYVLMYVYSYV